MRRLAIFATHPVQYHVPLFRELAQRQDIRLVVYFGLIPDARQQGVGFDVAFTWDIPLLEGYDWKVLKNTARKPSLGTFMGINSPGIRDQLIADQVDIVIVTGWQAFCLLQAIWACRTLKIPCLIRGESNTMHTRPLPLQFMHRILMRAFQRYLVVGKSNGAFYSQYGVPEEAMFSCSYCVDNDFFATRAEQLAPQRTVIRKAWGVKDNRTVFLFCGKLIPKKNPLDLLKAAASAMGTGGNLRVLIAGDGELRGECEAFAAEQNVPVTFLGFLNQTDLPKAYVAADCLVLPSDHRETWGLVVNEAMACGLPAIVSDQVGCGPDLIVPGRTGFVFPTGDIDALAAIIRELSQSPDVLPKMGRQSREHIGQYSVAAAAEGILAAIESIPPR